MPASLAILDKLCTKGRTLNYARNNADSQLIWHVNAGANKEPVEVLGL
jgi:hypothetical protein